MSHRIQLPGLDGANLLGFLAALGTFITFSECPESEGAGLEWQAAGSWHPWLVSPRPIEADALVQTLIARLCAASATRPFEIATSSGATADDLTILPSDYRQHAQNVSTIGDRRNADFAAALGSDSLPGPNGHIFDTAFRTMSGAGHQHFLKSMRELTAVTDASHIRAALFDPWVYDDDRPTMRWDPEDDRRYALRWKEPSGDKIRTVRGANRLAVEGLRLFPVVPVGRRVTTTGFTGKGASDTFFTWPIWNCPLGVDVLRSLLSVAGIGTLGRAGNSVTRASLRRLGVAEVYRSQRLTLGKYRSFSPAQPA